MNPGHMGGGPFPFGLGGADDGGGGGGAGGGGVTASTRGAAAPDSGVVSVCSLCNMRRADLRGACGHKYHARCIYSMPITRCPFCDQEFPTDNDGGLFILPVEPFTTDADVPTGKPSSGDSEEDRVGRDAEHHSRTGRWHSYETMYAQRIVADFDAGTLPLCEGTKLGAFLCNILNCSPSRLSKKLKIGKKCFQRRLDRPTGPEHIARHYESQKRLSDLEEMFLMAESRANRGMANAEILSECIQKEWRERLVEHALAVNQRLRNAWDWNAGRKRAERKRAELSTDALNKLLQRINPNQPSDGPTPNHLAPLFRVSSGPDANGATSDGGGAGGTGAGAGAGTGAGAVASQNQQMQNALLAQAMAHVLRSWQQGQCVPASDLFDPDLPAWQQGQQIPPQEAFRQCPPLAGGPQESNQVGGIQAGQPQGVPSASEQAMGGQAAGSQDVLGASAADIKGFVDEHFTSFEDNLASLAHNNSMVIEGMDRKPMAGAPVHPSLGTQQGQGLKQEHGVLLGENGSKESYFPLGDPQMAAMDIESNASGTPEIGAMASPATSAPTAALPAVASTQAGSTETVADTGRNRAAGAGSGAGAGAVGTAADHNGDDSKTDDHPFEDFIANFLDQVPFEAVDVWVPLCDRDQEGSEIVLFHAGYFTNVKDLEEWGQYSTNFSFRQGEGIPGRVFGSNQSEFHENVGNLDLSKFRRLNGARKIGIGTSFALPVVSRWGVTFVIVFYTRSKIQLDNEKKLYIESVVRSWKLDATVDTADDEQDSSRIAAKPSHLSPSLAASPAPAAP